MSCPLTSFSPNDMFFGETQELPLCNDHHLYLPQPAPIMENHQLYDPTQDGPSSCPCTYFPWENCVYHNPAVLTSTHVAPSQTPAFFNSWCPPTGLSVAEAQSPYSLPTMVGDHAFCVMINPPRVLWSTLADRPPIVDQEAMLPDFTNHPTPAGTLHMAPSHYPHSRPRTPHYSPSCQSFDPNSSHLTPHPSSRSLDGDPRPRPALRHVPYVNPTGPSRRTRATRAIEYHGLWIDEEELLKGLTEPDGKLNIHQCQWEEDSSPCHLWITGDKSCVSMHIQKWHGGKPGGDKSQTNCRWSTCAKTMRKESIARHIVTIHLEEMWECQGCGKRIARNDAYGRHAAKSGSNACRTLGAFITYSADARQIDARAALNSGGRVRYAGA